MLGKRNFGLDVIRALSIILVILSHLFVFDIELGVWGVEVFFVLSGFLIGQILIKDFQNGITISGILNFWKRRWYRTLPLYYAVILIKFVFFDSSLGWKILAYVFFLQNNFVGIGFFGVSWSLVIEEWFYILLPLVLVVLFRKGFSKEKFLYTLCAMILGFLILRTTWITYSHRTFDGIRPNFIFRFDSLLIGVLLGHLKIHYNNSYLKLSKATWFFPGLALMFFLIFNLGKVHVEGVSRADSYIFYRTLWFTLFSLSVFLIIPFFENSKIVERISHIKPLFVFFTWTSVLTYSMYLIQMFVFQIPVFFNQTILSTVTIHLLLLYGISYLIFRFYEHPMMMLRDKKIFGK